MSLLPVFRLSVARPLGRMASSSAGTTYHQRPMPSKARFHKPLPSNVFPRGYVLTGTHCGVKKVAEIPDLAVILSTSPFPTSAAACFTRNAFRAAPVTVSEEVIKASEGRARAVVVNSGCANAVTGKQGLEDAWAMVKATDALLPSGSSESAQTLVMSTGVIGVNLPISKILSALESLQSGPLGNTFEHWERAARAFMTTDTFPKLRARTFSIKGNEFRMAGMDKGAGMIHPDMGPPSKKELHATLLGCILTDAPVSPRSLQNALTYAVDRSFNSISVDGDMSTNDTIIVLANGAAVQEEAAVKDLEIDEERDHEAYIQFRDVLTDFAAELAQLVVRDGEGATKFVTVSVEGAATYSDAHAIASRISTSALVKTALYGEDAKYVYVYPITFPLFSYKTNSWGRILAATGSLSTLSTPVEPTRVSVSFIPTDGSSVLPLLVNGEPQKLDEVRAKEILVNEDLEIRVDLGLGKENAKYWSCDFSYVSINI